MNFDLDTIVFRTAPTAPAGFAPRDRLVFAAAHVIMHDAYADVAGTDPIDAHIDWAATGAFRSHLAACGFGIAEAMDTAQRFELGWSNAQRLIESCGELRLPTGFVAGASTDQLDATHSTDDLVTGVCEQIAFIHECGGIPMILPMPWLSENACDADTYVETYRRIIESSDGPLFIHWLGEMFLPALRGYFPQDSFERIMAIDAEKVRGTKISLLDREREIRIRRHIAANSQIVLTGDDFNFASLIAGGDDGSAYVEPNGQMCIGSHERVATGDFSHALLGIFDGIAAPAQAALRALDDGDVRTFRTIMDPLETLSRIIFEPPTRHYKVGLAFLAWLNGHQTNAMLPFHAEEHRSREHLWRVACEAARAGALTNPDLAGTRLESWIAMPSRA